VTTRRALISVADGAAHAFANLDNDVDGSGRRELLSDAPPPTNPEYRLDLLTGATVPATDGGRTRPCLDALFRLDARSAESVSGRGDMPNAD
jgi:hypothetical protein